MAHKHSWRQSLKDLTALTETMIATQNISSISGELSRRIARMIGARGCLIGIYDCHRRQFIAETPYVAGRKKIIPPFIYQINEKRRRLWNFRTQGTLLSNNPFHDNRLDPDFIAENRIESLIVAPMMIRKEILGIIALFNKPGKFSEFDSYFASVIAYQTAIILHNALLNERQQKMNNQMLLLSGVISELAFILDRNKIAQTTVERIKERFEYYFVAIGWADHREQVLKDWYYLPRFEVITKERDPRIPFSTGLTGLAVRTGRPVVVQDVSLSREYFNVLQEVKSELVMPVKIGDEVVAVLDLQSDRKNAFDTSDELMMATLAHALSTAIQNADSYHRLERANQQLVETMKMKDEIVQIVAHDFRSPLTVIRGYMDHLLHRSEWKNDRQKEIMETVSLQAQRLQRLAEATLKASRLDSGDIAFSFEKLDFASLLKRIIFPFSEKHQFVVEAEKNLPLVKADAGRLQEVMENLLSNAVKYSPEGGRVEVRAISADGGDLSEELGIPLEGKYLKVSVIDEGPGIPSDKKDLLFQRFARLHEGKRTEGVGLGLYICKKMIETHGGRIWVEDRPKGSCFSFILPSYQESASTRNVIIIDDDTHVLRILHKTISALGYDVVTATDGTEAIEKLQRFQPHLIILDAVMPHLGGVELIRRLKQRPDTCNVPLIVFTGKTDFQLPEEYRSIPVVSKNSGIQALVNVIQDFNG